MSLSTATALRSLAESAKPVADPRHTERLLHVQALLHDELGWVEQALAEASQVGVEPGIAAARHLVGNGGKRVRPTATLLSAACFGPVPDAVRELAVVVELVHSSTLLHDDVIDEGMERRGAPTARLMWGNAVSVLSGDVLLVHSLQRTQETAPVLMPGLLDTLMRLVSGEIVQLRGRSQLDFSELTYNRILQDKTASLFRFATSSGALLAGASVGQQAALGEFGERLGIAFQLVDDILDYSGEDTGKTLCADLREGKVTLPLVLAMQRRSSLQDTVARIHAGEDSVVERLRREVMETGACGEVRRRAEEETARALDALEAIDASPAKTLLVEVAQQLTSRTG